MAQIICKGIAQCITCVQQLNCIFAQERGLIPRCYHRREVSFTPVLAVGHGAIEMCPLPSTTPNSLMTDIIAYQARAAGQLDWITVAMVIVVGLCLILFALYTLGVYRQRQLNRELEEARRRTVRWHQELEQTRRAAAPETASTRREERAQNSGLRAASARPPQRPPLPNPIRSRAASVEPSLLNSFVGRALLRGVSESDGGGGEGGAGIGNLAGQMEGLGGERERMGGLENLIEMEEMGHSGPGNGGGGGGGDSSNSLRTRRGRRMRETGGLGSVSGTMGRIIDPITGWFCKSATSHQVSLV